MLCYVPRYMFVDAASLHDRFKLVAAVDVRGNGEETPIVTKPAVFVEDLQGNIEQFNVYFHIRLLSAGAYPNIAVEWTADDILFTKVLQINVGKSRKSAEEKHIANGGLCGCEFWDINELSDFFLCQEHPLGSLLADIVIGKRIVN